MAKITKNATYKKTDNSQSTDIGTDIGMDIVPGPLTERQLTALIEQEAAYLDDECNAVMSAVDWDANAMDIAENIPFKPGKTRKFGSAWNRWFSFSPWKLALPTMTAIFLLGIGLGYFMFHDSSPSKPVFIAKRASITEVSLDRMEETLARKEVVGYLKQTQMVLTDVLEQCSADSSFSVQNSMDKRRVRSLLNKSRYFKENLDDPKLMSSKPLLKKIEWLLYEILMTDSEIDNENSCQQLEKLQEFIKKERLMLKIRLIGKELSLSEV
jgi:hypothetical protein